MKVSIIIPVYNDEKYIGRSIQSALNQDFPLNEFEIIVVNDGSTDLTTEVVRGFGNKIKLINQKNMGPVRAANAGFRVAVGDYVVKLDSDDYFEKNLLSTEAKILDTIPEVDFVYSNYYEEFGGRKKEVYVDGNVFKTVAIGTMFRRDKFMKVGFYNEDVFFAEYDIFLRNPGWRGHCISKPLFTYFRRVKSLTGDSFKIDYAIQELKRLYPESMERIKSIRGYQLGENITLQTSNDHVL